MSEKVRKSRISRLALDIIISEKGWVNARAEDIAEEWMLKLHPRDLDRAVVQDIYVAGRRVLDYGDVDIPRVFENPFRGSMELKIKKEEDSHTSDSGLSIIQSEGESTLCGSYAEDGIDKNDQIDWVQSEQWKAGRKRKMSELRGDHFVFDQGFENVAKKMRMS